MKKKKKRVIKFKRILVLCLLILVILFLLWLFRGDKIKINDDYKDNYIASENSKVDLLDTNYKVVDSIYRGEVVSLKKKQVNEDNNQEYYLIKYKDKEYLIDINNLVENKNDIIKEKELYVRTPVTLYESYETSEILSLIKKGEKVEIIGYDQIKDGIVNMYKVKYNEMIGYVYSRYLVKTNEEAALNYDSEKTYLIHSARGDNYGGGSGANLDYYPYKKANFDDNVMPDEVRSLYINSSAISDIDSYISFAKESNINAFVVDIKDNTTPAYPAKAMEKYSKTNYNKARNTYDEYKSYIQKLKDNGFYVIGRITTFKDSYYVEDHPESAIADSSTGSPYKHNGSYWPSAFNRDVWEFNVELAKESVKEMGFNEIQFDYVRFPDRTGSLEKSGTIDMKNVYGEEKAQALQQFLFYACDEIHKVGAYVSADVFGESAHTYITAYGQYWPAMSNIVDVISAMPYPDHFNKNEYSINEAVWTVPYKLLSTWGAYVATRQTEIPTPAIARTWIQTYDTIREPYIVYDSDKIAEQISGLYVAGLKGGYMTWNSASSLAKYKSVSAAFKKEY